MKENFNRRNFIRMAAIRSAGLTFSGNLNLIFARKNHLAGKLVGIIGLDTSHAVAFTKTLNAADASPEYIAFMRNKYDDCRFGKTKISVWRSGTSQASFL